MAFLNRYSVRIQQIRNVIIFAQNVQHAKQLGELDIADVGDAEKIKAQSATFIRDGGGIENGVQLDEYLVKVRFRRNIVLDAEDNADARHWAEEDQNSYGDTESGSVQYQQVTFMKEKTGVTA